MSGICLFPIENIRIFGDLQRRINLNYSRLESRHYRPNHIFGADKSGWPGDWEGRTILALVKLWSITGREPAYLREILKILPSKLNSMGYLGDIYGIDNETGLRLFNEQQLSGHNWLLRGLLEYYILCRDESVKNIAINIVNNLFLPLIGNYKSYPISLKERDCGKGKYDGNICGKVGNWLISTDIGCAFICLDALSQAYDVLGICECKVLADEMLDVFSRIDFAKCAMQTHATLSATRGVLRLFSLTNDDKYLNCASNVFDIYISEGMTENYANFNWFSRPDSWTEPCAVIDSWICAMELYKFKNDYFYLYLANKIYRNAICYAQRVNGGFGCDRCVTPSQRILSPNGGADLTEAYWCCTMRGAEGLSSIASQVAFYSLDEDGNLANLFINIIEPSEISCDAFDLCIDCNDSGFDLRFINNTFKRIRIFCYNPFDNEPFSMFAEPGCFNWHYDYEKCPVFDGKRFWCGDRILGVRNIHSGEEIPPALINNLQCLPNYSYQDISTGFIFSPLSDMTDVEPNELYEESRQIIF